MAHYDTDLVNIGNYDDKPTISLAQTVPGSLTNHEVHAHITFSRQLGYDELHERTDHFEYYWYYYIPGNGWIAEGSSNATPTYPKSVATSDIFFTPRDDVTAVYITARAVSKTHEVVHVTTKTTKDKNGKKKTTTEKTTKSVSWYPTTGYGKSDVVYLKQSAPPSVPSVTTPTITGQQMTMYVDESTNTNCTHVAFIVARNDGAIVASTTWLAKDASGRVTYSCSVALGYEYRYAAFSLNANTNENSAYSAYSAFVGTAPGSVEAIQVLKATAKDTVHIEYTFAPGAETFTIEYAKDSAYFTTNPSEVKSVTGIATRAADITGLESGIYWYFRVKAINKWGEGGYCTILPIIVGCAPTAPTTTSESIVSKALKTTLLSWVHNSQDGSTLTESKIQIYVNGAEQPIITNAKDYYELDISSYSDGTIITWKVCTKGIFDEYSPWSVVREIKISEKPTLTFNVLMDDNKLTGFPINIKASWMPKTQIPLGYHVSIKSNQVYTTVDNVGDDKIVSKDEVIFSEYYDIKTDLELAIQASDVDLLDNMSYTITCIVATDSGLSSDEFSYSFTVNWAESDFKIMINGNYYDSSTYVYWIRPYAYIKLPTGKWIYSSQVLLSLYRKEFNGKYTEIKSDFTQGKWIMDEHPSLYYANYRVVGKNIDNGVVQFVDIGPDHIGEKSIIIQWAEKWTESVTGGLFHHDENVAWTTSLLELPYNIDVADNYDPDSSLVKYIGREHPVSYYGTQTGETATWNTEIPKEDTDTLYQIRRLAVWKGDVYVREPSGSGYWANVKVSFNQKHCALTIPITFNITRVEGGA